MLFKPFHSWNTFKSFIEINIWLIILALIPLIIAIYRTMQFNSSILIKAISIILEIIIVYCGIALAQKRPVPQGFTPIKHPFWIYLLMIVLYIIAIIIIMIAF